MRTKRRFFSAFDEWLNSTPRWKETLDEIDQSVFSDLKIRKERLEKIFEKLDEYDFFKIYSDEK